MDFLRPEVVLAAFQSPYAIGAALAIALSIVVLYFFKELSVVWRVLLWLGSLAALGVFLFVCALLVPQSTEIEPRDPPDSVITGTGYYEDIKDIAADGTFVFEPASEELSLRVYSDGYIDGQSSGVVEQGPERTRTEKVWNQFGYRSGEMLFIVYYTSSENGQRPVSPGIGSYTLRKQTPYFFGRIVYWDSRFQHTFDCPYVFVQTPENRQLTEAAAMERWAFLRGGCRIVHYGQPTAQGVPSR